MSTAPRSLDVARTRSAAVAASRTCALAAARSSEPALSSAPPPLPLAAGHRGPRLTPPPLAHSTPSSPPTRLQRTCACSSTARPCFSVCIESWRRRCSSQAMSKPRPVWPASAADWPRLADAWGSLWRALALKAAAGEPANRRLSRLAFDTGGSHLLLRTGLADQGAPAAP